MNKNRVISFILAMVMSFSILAEARIPVMAVSDDGTTGEITTVTETETGSEENKCGENAYWRYDSETSSVVIYGTGPMYDYTLDQSTQRTDTPWDTLVNSHVVIEEGITYIGEYAFSGFGFTEITIPDSVESIGNRAFYNCTFLTDIHVGEGLKSDISAAFEGCTALKNVHIPDLEYWLEEDRNLYLAIFDTSALKVCTFNLYINGEKVTDIVIPDSVTKIRANAFRNQDITSVTIHNNVTEIGDYAFAHYWNGSFAANPLLTTVVIPDSVVTIGDYAFYGNCNLKDITVSANLEKIGKYAFADCSGLSAIDIPATVSVIDNYAFAGCSGVTTINIPASLQYIGDCAFTGIDKVYTYVELPETVTYLGKTPFGTAITEMILPDSLETIGDSAFAGCTALTAIALPADLTTIGDYAFDGCTSLATINIPDKVESIGEAAFRNCTSLTAVALPDSVTTLGAYAFYASGILNIDMSANLTEIQPYTFYECNFTAIDIPDTVVKIDSYAFYGCDQLGELVLPSKLEYVGNHAFKNCYVMTTGELPQTITFIGDHGFDDCHKMVITKLPAGLTALNQYVFRGCHAFTEITIPAAVESLKGAFYCCFGLKEIYFEGDAPTIDYNSFGGVTGTCYYPKGNTTYTSGITGSSYGGTLNWVELGAETSDKCGENITWELSDDGVLTLTGTGAMYDYDGTNAVYAPWYNQKTAIKSVEISDGITHLGKQAFSACSNLTAVSIPETVVSAGTYVFEKCTSLTSVVLPDGLTYIPEGMFSGCSNLVDVDFPETITTIGNSAFGGCTQLGSVVLPEGLVSIGEEAFNGCGYTDWGYNSTGYNFTSVTLPSTVKTIGKGAFKSCNSLTTINIPYGVTSIGEYAFGRAGISSIIIPSTVTSVGTGTFRWCKRLKTAYFYGDAPEFGSDMFGLMEGQKTTVYYPGSNETWTADLIAIHDNYYCDFVAWEATDEPGAGGGSGGGAGDNEGDDSQTGGGSEGSGTEGGDSSGTTGGTGSGDGSDGSETGGTGGTGSEGSDGDGTGGEGSGTGTGGTGTAETFTLTFDLNGRELASIYSAPQPVEVSGELTSLKGLLPTGESTDGCCLVGWYYEPECITPLTLETDIIEKDITVYAKWLEHTSTPSDLPVEKPIMAQGRCGENLTWTLDENGLLTIRGTGAMYDYVIDYNTFTTTAPWFNLKDSITSVVIEEGVTSVGNYAFREIEIKEASIADSVETIGDWAFSYNASLGNVVLPEGVTYIGEGAFYEVHGITTFTIPAGVEAINDYAFGFCKNLNEITISDNVQTIGNYAFIECGALTKITIPASVKNIKNSAFLSCNSLKTVIYNGTQEQWNAITIETDNQNLENADITYKGDFVTLTFDLNGRELASIYSAPQPVEVSGELTSLKGLLPTGESTDGCCLVGWYYEPECITPLTLETDIIEKDITVYAKWLEHTSTPSDLPVEKPIMAQGRCGENLTWTLDENGLLTIRGTGDMYDYVIDYNTFTTTAPWFNLKDSITSLVIEDGVTYIGSYAFGICSSIAGNLVIPDSVTSIGEGAFVNCFALDGTLTLSENFTNIPVSAFENCILSGELVIPEGVTEINDYAFYGCNFTSVVIPEGVTSIGNNAFFRNRNLTAIEIPSTVTTIGDGAFSSCSAVTEITFYGADVPEFPASVIVGVFSFTDSLTTVYVPVDSYDAYVTALTGIVADTVEIKTTEPDYIAAGECGENLTWIITNDGTLTISGTGAMDEYAYSHSVFAPWYDYRDSITKVVIEEGVTSIGKHAFYYMTAMTDISLPESLEYISSSAFYVAKKLTSIKIPSGITEIPVSAFTSCSELVTVELPENLTSIGTRAFYGCTKLKNITLPENLTHIDSEVFELCSALKEINIPEGLTSIGTEAFKTGTTMDVYYASTKSDWDSKFSEETIADIFTNTPTMHYGKYDITVTQPENGTVAVDKTIAAPGETVTVTATPADGYNLNQILVDGCPIQETTFEVRCDHTVTAEFVVDNIVNGTCGENLIWELDKSTGLLTISGNGAMDDYSYTSETVGEEIVLSTTAPWSVWGDWITSVVIGSGVTHIGEFAFSYMDRLTGSLTIPDTVTSIGKQAFYCCSGLTGDLTIPDSVTDIGEMAFANCEGFNGTLTLPENLTEIKDSVFSYCSFTGTLTIPAGVTSIGMGAFGGNKFKTIELPEGLLSIGKAAFQNNKKRVGQLTIPDSVTTIGAGAFTGCQGLTSVVFGTGLTTFVEDEWSTPLFGECTLIEKVTFYGTTPATITEISNPFSGMTGLKQIYVPMASYNKYVSRYSAFVAETVEFVAIEPEGTCGENLKWKITSDGTLTISGTGAMTDYASNSTTWNPTTPWYSCVGHITKVVVEDGVNTIGNYAFNKLYNVTDISLPDSITSIGKSSFSSCLKLKFIEIPDGVTVIPESAFNNCDEMVSAKIPDSVTSIADYAFDSCEKLVDIELPASLQSLGYRAFNECRKLAKVVIPAGVKAIPEKAFYYCQSLSEVTLPEGLTKIERRGFGYTAITSISLPESITYLASESLASGETIDVYYASSKSKWNTVSIDYAFSYDPVMHYGKYDITVTQPEDGTIAVDKTIAAPDETVTVTVTPNRYRRLDAIYVNDQPITGNTFMPQADSVVTATFNKVKYTVKLSTDGKFTTDAYLVVEAEDSLADKLPTPADTAIYEFGGWYKDADCTQPWDTATDMVTDDTTLYAKAILKSYTATVQQAENGTVTLDKQVYSAGETVTITAAPNLDYELDKIYVNGAEIAGNTFIIVEDSTVTASFKRIVVNNAVTNLTASQTFSKTVVLTWNKHTDSRVVSYTISRDGVAIGTTQECMFVDRNLTPETQYQYSVTANTAGTVTSPAKEITVKTALPVIKSITTGTIKNKINDENNTIRINVVNSGNLGALNDEEKTTGNLYLNDGQDYPLIGADELHTDSTGSWYTVEWDVTNVADGEYNVTFVLTDVDLAEAEYTETILVDRSTPEKINQLVATGQVSRIILSWTKATEVDTIQYNIYRRAADEDEFTLLKTVNGRDTLTYADTTALEDVEYTYYIAGVNEFEQEGTPSDTVVASLSKDKEKPTVTKITPANMSYINGTVTFNVIAQDNAGVVKTELYYSVDDQTSWIQMPDMSKTFSLAFDTATLEDGVVYIKGIAYDEAGNVSDGLTYKYMIDNTGPQQVTNLSYESTSVTVTLKWDDVADEDVKFFRVERMMDDGTYVKLADVYSTLGYNIYGLQPDTQYTYRVTAYDHVGNAGQPSEDIVAATLADTTAPVVTNISPNPGSWSTGIDLAITAKDENTVAEITVQVSTDALTWTDVYTAAFTDGNKSRTARYTLSLDGYEDGYIYVRGIAKDAAGNESDSSIDAPYTQHKIDKTAPAAPAGLTATGYAGYIEIKWSADSSDNISSYSVYRADAADGEYTLLANVKTLNYFDRTVESNVTYYYKAEAVDIAGNKSDCSEAVSAMSAVDEEKPYLVNFAPATGSTVGIGNRTVGASFTDNGELAKVVIEISKDGESYTLLTEKTEIGSYGAIVEGKIPVDEFADGETVYIRYSAVDTAGNISEYALAEYVVDAAAPVVKTAAAEFADNVVVVSWTGAQESDLAGYKIYRRDSAESEYSIIGQAAVNSTAAQYIYKDINLSEEEITYFYMIEAVDKNGNTAQFETAPITLPERGIPVPELNCETALENGVEYIFDASESRDNGTIVSYFFDFGDGTTSTKAKSFHKYDEVGDYTITLTVTDNLGNTATKTKNVSVKEQKMLGKLKVLVVDETGVPVPGASVYMDLGEEYQVKKQTDSNGYVTFTADAGEHSIGAFISNNEWLPVQDVATIKAGKETEVALTMVHQPLIEGEFTVNRMTFDEIVAAGIDVSDPANHNIFEVTISFLYGDTPVQVPGIYNPSNNELQFVSGDGEYSSLPGGGSVKAEVVEKNEDGEPTKLALFQSNIEGSFLKEFFDVKLYIINNADTEFSMVDNVITLNVPEGLSVVKTDSSAHSNIVKIEEIKGKATEVINWILRGDKEGEYSLTADYVGTLNPFNEQVATTFVAKDPVKVYGLSAIKLVAQVNSTIYNGDFYFRLGIENTSDVEIYLPKLDFENKTISQYFLNLRDPTTGIEYTEPVVEHLDTIISTGYVNNYLETYNKAVGKDTVVTKLAPGERMMKVFVVRNVPSYDNIMYLHKALIHVSDEYDLQYEIVKVDMGMYSTSEMGQKLETLKNDYASAYLKTQTMYGYITDSSNFMYVWESLGRDSDWDQAVSEFGYQATINLLGFGIFHTMDEIRTATRDIVRQLMTDEDLDAITEQKEFEKYTRMAYGIVNSLIGMLKGEYPDETIALLNDILTDVDALNDIGLALYEGGAGDAAAYVAVMTANAAVPLYYENIVELVETLFNEKAVEIFETGSKVRDAAGVLIDAGFETADVVEDMAKIQSSYEAAIYLLDMLLEHTSDNFVDHVRDELKAIRDRMKSDFDNQVTLFIGYTLKNGVEYAGKEGLKLLVGRYFGDVGKFGYKLLNISFNLGDKMTGWGDSVDAKLALRTNLVISKLLESAVAKYGLAPQTEEQVLYTMKSLEYLAKMRIIGERKFGRIMEERPEDGDEYSRSNTLKDINTFRGTNYTNIDEYVDGTIAVITQYIDNIFGDVDQDLNIPEAPAVTLDLINYCTNESFGNTYEYSYEGTEWHDCSDGQFRFEPSNVTTWLWIRQKATREHPAGNIAKVAIPAMPLVKGDFHMVYENGCYNVSGLPAGTYQYAFVNTKRVLQFTGSITVAQGETIKLPENAGWTYLAIRADATETSTASQIRYLTKENAWVADEEDRRVTGLKERTTKEELVTYYRNKGIHAVEQIIDNVENAKEYIGTGTVFEIAGNIFKAIVKGDVNGDAFIDKLDLRGAIDHVNSEDRLEAEYLDAGCIKEKEDMDLFDIYAMINYIETGSFTKAVEE